MATIPTWGGRRRWLAAVCVALDQPDGQQLLARHHVALDTVVAIATADAQVADHRTGRSVATAHATVARALGVCSRTVQRGRQVLLDAGLAAVVAAGRYLTTSERQQAVAAGRHQIRAASTRVLTLPRRLAHVHLPRRGSRTPHTSRQCMGTKRALTRAKAATKRTIRPIWLQRLAARLAARLPWLATGHIGRLCDSLGGLPISPDWTATDIIDTLDARNRSLGLLALPPTSQHHPAALLAHQLTDALTHDINAHQDRITIQAQHQQRVASQQAARVQLRADQDRHLEYLADHTARSRVTAALTAVRVHLRAQTAKTRSRTHSPACPAES
ncbi:MAG: hypothetical protein L0K65_03145 [Actinomyces sp.]|nr:hypothetical protein [Actinomyces sp.]